MTERTSKIRVSNEKNAGSKSNGFSRDVDKGLIKKLMASDLWADKLEIDCKKREVFLAIRPSYISFYHKGGGLFTFDNKGFKTNVNYSVLLDRTGYKSDYIYEDYLQDAKLIKKFYKGYDGIKKNCKNHSDKSEAEGVSRIYHQYPYNFDRSDVVVLDVEVALIDTPEDSKKAEQRRIDILLYHKLLKKLRFIEAKRYDNNEIRAKNSSPQVIGQLQSYRDIIKAQRENILDAYKKYTKTLEKIFSNLSLPEPQEIDENVGLLIFGFDQNQMDGRLNDQIIKNPEFNGIPYYPIGDITKIKAENLWKGTE
jgi:hypothetical protein